MANSRNFDGSLPHFPAIVSWENLKKKPTLSWFALGRRPGKLNFNLWPAQGSGGFLVWDLAMVKSGGTAKVLLAGHPGYPLVYIPTGWGIWWHSQGLAHVPLCFTSPNWGYNSSPTDIWWLVMWKQSPKRDIYQPLIVSSVGEHSSKTRWVDQGDITWYNYTTTYHGGHHPALV